MNDEQKEQIELMKEKVNNGYLGINRVPKKELEWFLNWCAEEFEGDRGMALKWLCQGYMPPENLVLIEEINKLNDRLNLLESKIVSEHKDSDNIVKLGDGRIIRKR